MKQCRLILVLISVVFCAFLSEAKSNEKKTDKTAESSFLVDKAKKEASFCVNHLKLKGDSAKIFTEIYINYQKDLHKAFEKNRTSTPSKAFVQRTRNQADTDIRKRFAMAHDLLNIREKYYSKFLRVISPEQYETFSFFEQRLGEMMRQEKRQRENKATSTNREKTTNRAAGRKSSQSPMIQINIIQE